MADRLLVGLTQIEVKDKLNTGKVWSTMGVGFRTIEPDTTTVTYNNDVGRVTNDVAGNTTFTAAVNLPNGAVVTHCVVFGSDATTNWVLQRNTLQNPGTAISMANSTVETEDDTITEPTIDNVTFGYWIQVTIGQSDTIEGARIKYTI